MSNSPPSRQIQQHQLTATHLWVGSFCAPFLHVLGMLRYAATASKAVVRVALFVQPHGSQAEAVVAWAGGSGRRLFSSDGSGDESSGSGSSLGGSGSEGGQGVRDGDVQQPRQGVKRG